MREREKDRGAQRYIFNNNNDDNNKNEILTNIYYYLSSEGIFFSKISKDLKSSLKRMLFLFSEPTKDRFRKICERKILLVAAAAEKGFNAFFSMLCYVMLHH